MKQSVSHKKYRLFVALIACTVIMFFCYNFAPPSYPASSSLSLAYEPNPDAQPDILGSWVSINQDIKRPENWQRQVSNISAFQLGEELTFNAFNGRTYYEINSNCSTHYKRSYGTFPAIDGSTVLVPLAAEFGWQFLDLSDDDTRNFFNFSTTHDAFVNLVNCNNINGVALRRSSREVVDGKFTTNYWDVHYFVKAPDIVFMTPPSQEELALAQTQGVELTIKPVCYDSFVFITHKDNPVDNLSTEQVQKIYSGEITNWNQVGGHDEEITAFQREKGSGSQTAMEELVMAGLEMMDAPEGLRIGGMGFMIDRFTAEYQNAPGSIGYTYKYYIDTLYKSQDIKVLSIDGIAPDNENVRNISYPFVVPYNGVIRSADANGIGGKFLDFVLSEEGQKCVAQAGYVSVLSVQ